MTDDPEIHGSCHPEFEIVRDAFAANFRAGMEIGACAAVVVDGEAVLDIWAGTRNDVGDPWDRDTIVNVYSTTKTMASICMLMLAEGNFGSMRQSPGTGPRSPLTARTESWSGTS